MHRPSDQPAGASPNQQGASVAKCLTLIASDRCSARHSSYCGSGCSQLSGERPNALGNRIAMSGEDPRMAVEGARRAARSRGTSHSRNARSRVSTSLTRSNIQRITPAAPRATMVDTATMRSMR